MTKTLKARVLREGTVDTRNYRYRIDSDKSLQRGEPVIVRLPIDALDTTAALTDWEEVQ